MITFEDHFSQRAHEYAQYRPSYPGELFAYLASIAPKHGLAWDCGTGNGQAAIKLAEHFHRVVATDASSDQLSHAFLHERIEYRAERAEAVSLDTDSVDLVTVAVAVHWFDFEKFYREVRRVLKPEGILAVWTYHMPVFDLNIEQILRRYYSEVLADYWPERFQYVDARYRTLPFPFKEIQAPDFAMEAEWNLSQLVGFLDSWSATRKYENEHKHHPVEKIWTELSAAWGVPDRLRTIRWPLYFRIGRV
jgi:SAM-dependent methyltransferase